MHSYTVTQTQHEASQVHGYVHTCSDKIFKNYVYLNLWQPLWLFLTFLVIRFFIIHPQNITEVWPIMSYDTTAPATMIMSLLELETLQLCLMAYHKLIYSFLYFCAFNAKMTYMKELIRNLTNVSLPCEDPKDKLHPSSKFQCRSCFVSLTLNYNSRSL